MTEIIMTMTCVHVRHTLEIKIPKVVIPHWISISVLSKETSRKALLEHLAMQTCVCERIQPNIPLRRENACCVPREVSTAVLCPHHSPS